MQNYLVFETGGDDDDMIRCTACFQANPDKTVWINRKASKRHVKTAEHLSNVSRNAKIQQDEEARQHQLMASYSSLAHVAFNVSLPDPVLQSRANLFADDSIFNQFPLDPNEDDNFDSDYNDMFAPLDNLKVPAGVEPFLQNRHHEQDLLKREVELLLMSAEHADEFGNGEDEDDITLTNIAEHFRSLGEFDQNYLILTC